MNILSNYEDINLFIPSNPNEFKYLFEKIIKINLLIILEFRRII